jgi:hypothetical protein
MKKITWPAWFNSPDGKTAIFEKAEDVPKDWTSGAEKQSAGDPTKEPAKKKSKQEPVKQANTELDAYGHPYDPEMHAQTQSKTKEGLWRMKVGVSRPAPAPGYPLDL